MITSDNKCPHCNGTGKTGEGFSNCCGVKDRMIPRSDCSYSDYGLCPECRDHCEYDYSCPECNGRGWLTEDQLYPTWTAMRDRQTREEAL